LKSQPLRIDELGVPALFTEAARFQSWLDLEAALAGRRQSSVGTVALLTPPLLAKIKQLVLPAATAG